jgi:2,4-dienoyl-CoA reductase-like NADH-dependent reductase (Old Yellow Enzyme family)
MKSTESTEGKSSMNPKHKPIFEPITINGCEIKNRIVMAPMNCNYTAPDHYISKQQMAYYAARAKGGTGLIITEAQAVSTLPCADTYRKYNNPYLTDYRYLPLQCELVEHVHSFGAKIFAQLFTGPGRQGSHDIGAAEPVSASPVPWRWQFHKAINSTMDTKLLRGGIRMSAYFGEIPDLEKDPEAFLQLVNKIPTMHMLGQQPREITKEEIQQLIKDEAKGAALAKAAGYDGVEIHACHGYLVHSFLTERSNFRKDEYGGSFENRIRFLLELIRLVRRAVGPDYPVGVRFSASDDLPGGYDPYVAAMIAKRVEEEGADFINLSDGSYEAMSDFLPNTEGQVIDKSAIIQAAVKIPVICPSVHNPENVVDVLKNGKASMVSQGRQMIADPDWVNKVREGRENEIIKCTRCNLGCIIRFVAMMPVRCVKNPRTGQEEHIEEYMRRPIIPIKNRVWQTITDWAKKEPSELWEYAEGEYEEMVKNI